MTTTNTKCDATITTEADQVLLTSGRLEVTILTAFNRLDACSLRDLTTGAVFADARYVWPGDVPPTLVGEPRVKQDKTGGAAVTFTARLGDLAIEQTFETRPESPDAIFEIITLRNTGPKTIENQDFRCGFAKVLKRGNDWTRDADAVPFCGIPYRRDTDGVVRDFPLRRVVEQPGSFAGWREPVVQTPTWGSEGWVWSADGASLLLAKYNADAMEWSLLTPIVRKDETVLCFGGAGIWKHGSPEAALRLEPGKSYTFGETTLKVVDGGWKSAYRAYRDYSEAKGCRTPAGYNPPVHWNELYDNKYYRKVCDLLRPRIGRGTPGFTPEMYTQVQALLDEFYTLDLMKVEAAKAQELGCEALYLDPGWDKFGKRGGLHIWDDARMGPMTEFIAMIKKDYGLQGVSLWCSLAGVPPTFVDALASPAAQVLTKAGVKDEYLLCHPSTAFLEEKEKLLLELCRNGALFLMFDSNQFSGPCYDKSHGHGIPSTCEEHARATCELARRIKAKYPHVLIEMHDPITGPCGIHYTPTYYGYAPATSFDCLWGHEFMWKPLDDLLSRKAVSLYYYNLAYSIPLYLHVNLQADNANALIFWWFASTCRHLGVGGKPADPAVWEAEKNAMRRYMPLKRFYTQGVFYGLDEMIHAHTLPDLRASVMNVFNLADQPAERTIAFRFRDVGLPSGRLTVEGAEAQQDGDAVTLKLKVAGKGHALVKLKVTE